MANRLKSLCRFPLAMRTEWLAGCVLLWLHGTTASACELPSWQAHYNIIKYGATIARLDLSLQITHDQAQYRLHTEASGFLSALSDEELTETSQLKQIADKTWQLQSFSQQRMQDKTRYQKFVLATDNSTLHARGEYNGKPFSLDLQPPAWDRSSAQLALTCDLLAENKPRPVYDYSVIDNGSLSNYRFEYRGQENIRLADRKFDTLKFERISGHRSTLLWLAPALNYMPVRMEQHKKGRLHLQMNLDIPVTKKP
ncbi:MAG: hypothetical protein QG652_1122 [Pseudomonadota bacterium]|nr:hypothetical protein [Pseudomonadota bacterium]